ncbi:MAG TPA: hypothetical protein VEM32_06585 [Geobacteraceae bacterium]|nr:hypothetical protein [Geobacteraceae bacterium]
MVKRLTGMNGLDFSNAFKVMDPDALAALMVILHARDKIKVSIDDVNIDFDDFGMEITPEEQDQVDRLEKEMKEAADRGMAPKASLPPNGLLKRAGWKTR